MPISSMNARWTANWLSNELYVYIRMTETLVQGRKQRQEGADNDHLNYIHPHPAPDAGASPRPVELLRGGASSDA